MLLQAPEFIAKKLLQLFMMSRSFAGLYLKEIFVDKLLTDGHEFALVLAEVLFTADSLLKELLNTTLHALLVEVWIVLFLQPLNNAIAGIECLHRHQNFKLSHINRIHSLKRFMIIRLNFRHHLSSLPRFLQTRHSIIKTQLIQQSSSSPLLTTHLRLRRPLLPLHPHRRAVVHPPQSSIVLLITIHRRQVLLKGLEASFLAQGFGKVDGLRRWILPQRTHFLIAALSITIGSQRAHLLIPVH